MFNSLNIRTAFGIILKKVQTTLRTYEWFKVLGKVRCDFSSGNSSLRDVMVVLACAEYFNKIPGANALCRHPWSILLLYHDPLNPPQISFRCASNPRHIPSTTLYYVVYRPVHLIKLGRERRALNIIKASVLKERRKREWKILSRYAVCGDYKVSSPSYIFQCLQKDDILMKYLTMQRQHLIDKINY